MRLHFSPFSTTLASLKSHLNASVCKSGNGAVAQSVERSPEKAGVGGSIPPCPTCKINAYGRFQGGRDPCGVHMVSIAAGLSFSSTFG